MKNVSLPKFILLVQLISEEILAQVRSEHSIEILLRLAWIVHVLRSSLFKKDLFGVIRVNWCLYTSLPICTNRLNFNKWTFFILFFLDMRSYPIISQILSFVTSPLSSLLSGQLILRCGRTMVYFLKCFLKI